MKNLIENLKQLSNYGIIGMKQSFEDEGVLLDDIITVKRITELCGLQSFVKIGGCEAKTDLYNCVKLGVNGVIAPMIETPFALLKFNQIINDYPNKIDPYIVIESKTSYENLNEILKNSKNKLKGIVVGRSDFSKSYNLNKSEVDSDFIYDKVEDILKQSKKYNFITILGGNISVKSTEFIKRMYKAKLLDRIETRNIVIELNEQNINDINEIIQDSLNFEISWLKYKLDMSSFLNKEYSSRIELLSNRK
jgi:4-hydroxy-2-oxoheptanedioate aldolase